MLRVKLPFGMFLMACLLLPAFLRAQNELPPEAQSAFDRGLAAVEQQQWDMAVKYFAQVQESAKRTPQVLFNLGLAHGKAGHPLTGIIWLHAYLAVSPHAANAQAVRMVIARLEVANEARIARINQQALAVAMQIQDEDERDGTVSFVHENIAESGDIDGALKNYPLTGEINHLWKHYLESKAGAGDIQTVLDGLSHLRPDRIMHKDGTFNITVEQADREERDFKIVVLGRLAEFQEYPAGDWEGARTTIDQMSQFGMSAKDREDKLKELDIWRIRAEDRIKERAELNQPPPTAVDPWLLLAKGYFESAGECRGVDVDLDGALLKVNPSPAGKNPDEWRGDVVQSLASSVLFPLVDCSNKIQAIEQAIAWQASHPQAK